MLEGGVFTAYVNNTVLLTAVNLGACQHHPTQSIIQEIHHLAMARHVEIQAI